MGRVVCMRRRTWVKGIIVGVLLFMTTGITVSATTKPLIEVDGASVDVGDELEVDINVYHNPGITAMGLNVSYDRDKLKLTDVVFNEQIGGYTVGPQTYNKSEVFLTWLNGINDYKQEAFSLATLSFVAENEGISEIRVSYNEDNVFNVEEESISFATNSGIVSVLGEDNDADNNSSSEDNSEGDISGGRTEGTTVGGSTEGDTTVGGSTEEDTTVGGSTKEDTTVDGSTKEDTTVGGSTTEDITLGESTTEEIIVGESAAEGDILGYGASDENELDESDLEDNTVREGMIEGNINVEGAQGVGTVDGLPRGTSKGKYILLCILGIVILLGAGFVIYKKEYKK